MLTFRWIGLKTKAIWLVIGCALLLPLAAHGEIRWLELSEIPNVVRKAPGYDSKVQLCSLHLYSKDADVRGTNIRTAPTIDAPIIGTIPGERAEAGTRIGPEFEVIGSKDGWLLVRNAYWRGYEYGEKLLLRGPGWISAGLVGFEIENSWLYDAPRADARKILRLSSPDNTDAESLWGPDSVQIKRVYGCSGSFLDVDLETPDGQKARGWITSICGNQVTTCIFSNDTFTEEHNGRLVTRRISRGGEVRIYNDED